MPPRIFIQMGISTWAEITVQQQKLSLARAKLWPLPTAICPENPALSALQRHGPGPACPGQAGTPSPGRGRRATGAQLLHPQVDSASCKAGTTPPLPRRPLRSRPLAASYLCQAEPPQEGGVRGFWGCRGKGGQVGGTCLPAPGRHLVQRPGGLTLLIPPSIPSPGGQYIFCRLGRMASLMKEKTTRIPKRLPRLPLVK